MSRLSSIFRVTVRSKFSPQSLPFSNATPKHNLLETSSFSTSTIRSPVHSIFSILSPNTTFYPNSFDYSFHSFSTLRNVSWLPDLPHDPSVQQRDSHESFQQLVKIGGQLHENIEQLVKFYGQLLAKLVHQATLEDYIVFFNFFSKSLTISDNEDDIAEKINILCHLLQNMRENHVPVDERMYGPILQYFIDTRKEKEFHSFLDVFKDKNGAALPGLGYYEMSLYLRLNKEEKIEELCHYISSNDSDETAELRENYLLALYDGDRKNELLQLFQVIDVSKVLSTNNLAMFFNFFAELSLEYAVKLLLAFKDLRNHGADAISEVAANPDLPDELREMEIRFKINEGMIVYFCKKKEVYLALDVVDTMCERGLSISNFTLNLLLRLIKDNLEFHLGPGMYTLLGGKGRKPTKDTFKMLIRYCMNKKQWYLWASFENLRDLELEHEWQQRRLFFRDL